MALNTNILVISSNEQIVLYSHRLTPNELNVVLYSTLARRKNWDNLQYLAGTIFSEMIKDNVIDENDFGISQEVWDGDVVFTLNVATNKIIYEGLNGPEEMTFGEFVASQSNNINIEQRNIK